MDNNNDNELQKALDNFRTEAGRFVTDYPLAALVMVGGVFALGYSYGNKQAIVKMIQNAIQ